MTFNLCQSILILEDGSQYKGWSFCQYLNTIGEIVFNTGMTGYQEIMTDPSYCGQIIIFTYPEIGNTGLNNDDYESGYIHVKGIVARDICYYPSNWRSYVSLPEYLQKYKIPHIFGIDTRALTKRLRNYGVMQAQITLDSNLQFASSEFNQATNALNLPSLVTTNKPHNLSSFHCNNRIYSHLDYKISKLPISVFNYNIVILDFGVKFNILRRLLVYGCNLYILPVNTSYEVIASYKPDGILLSNGPGDPAIVKFAVNTVRQLILFSKVPIFGICMGHQVLNLALKAETFKLKFGHRGLNHPSGIQQKSEITSQNHGFAVNIDSYLQLQKIIHITHFNLNDLTIAGILHSSKPIFSVQYHPEASPGPHDSDYLFKSFLDLISIIKNL